MVLHLYLECIYLSKIKYYDVGILQKSTFPLKANQKKAKNSQKEDMLLLYVCMCKSKRKENPAIACFMCFQWKGI